MKLPLPRRMTESTTWRSYSRACAVVDGLFRLKPAVVLVCLFCCGVHGVSVLAANGGGRGLTGADVYLRYCSGCHGFDGFAEYPHAPSFAMGDRLHKSDEQLLHSVLTGRHAMPYWQGKLSIDMFRNAISYLRTMEQRHRSGQPPREQPIPDMHYKFNPVGEAEDYWENWH